MRKFLQQLWREEDGVLSFEWTVLTSMLTIGAVAGIAAVRDAVDDEMADLAQAMTSLDQSYIIEGPLMVSVHSSGNNGFSGYGGVYGGGGYGGYSGNGVSYGSHAVGSVYRDDARVRRGNRAPTPRGRLENPASPAEGMPTPAARPDRESPTP